MKGMPAFSFRQLIGATDSQLLLVRLSQPFPLTEASASSLRGALITSGYFPSL